MKTRTKILLIDLIFLFCIVPIAFAKTSSLRRTPTVVAVEKASPAVVNISTEQIVRSRSSFGSSDPFFDQFFRDFLEPFPRRQYKQSSLGSGVVIDARGYVLTNHHVILKASKITITLADNREFEGELIGADARSDLAVVKVLTTEKLPVATMGRSDDLMIGEPVITIGNPFGLSHTISTGVISALNRSIRLDDEQILRGFVQTDAPINPGNSGGPLVNILGEIIGINTAIYGNAQGIGFAIPIDKAKRIIDDLVEFGEVRTAWIGIDVQDITPAIAQFFEHHSSDGVLIAQVFEKSSAARAGLKQGDIILEMNDQLVGERRIYDEILTENTANDTNIISIIRDGKSHEIKVKAEEFSLEQAVKIASRHFGFVVEEITEQKISTYRLQTEKGLVLTKIHPNSSAHQVGLEPGDVIRQIEGVQIENLDDFRDVLMKLSRETQVMFLIQRKHRGYYVTLERR